MVLSQASFNPSGGKRGRIKYIVPNQIRISLRQNEYIREDNGIQVLVY